jgi:outer membrane protein assembly factor BamB
MAADGTLSGTPTAAATSYFTVKVTDSFGLTATARTAITVRAIAPAQWLRPFGTDGHNPTVLTMPLGKPEFTGFSQRWSAALPAGATPSEGFAIGGGRAYVIVDGGNALAAYTTAGTSGTTAWSTPAPSGVTWMGGTTLSGTGSGATLYALLSDGSAAALNPSTGAILWRTTAGTNGQFWQTAPILAGGRLVVRSAGALTAYDLSTHAVAWSVPAGQARGVSSDGATLLSIEGCELQARRASDGVKLWGQTLADCNVGLEPPVVHDGGVYLLDGSRYRAFNPSTGQQLWSRQGCEGVSGEPRHTLAVNEQCVVTSCWFSLQVLDRLTGEVVREDIDSQTAGSVTLVGDTALVNVAGGTLSAVDILTGEELWSSHYYGFADQIIHTQVSEGRVYWRVQDGGNRLISFGTS